MMTYIHAKLYTCELLAKGRIEDNVTKTKWLIIHIYVILIIITDALKCRESQNVTYDMAKNALNNNYILGSYYVLGTFDRCLKYFLLHFTVTICPYFIDEEIQRD